MGTAFHERMGVGGLVEGEYRVHDWISNQTFVWKDEKNYVELDPNAEPVHLLQVL